MNTSFPSFNNIQLEKIVPDLQKILADNRAFIEQRLSQGAPYTWDNFITPWEEHGQVLAKFFSPISHLHAVKDSPELREVYNQCEPLLTEYATELGQNKALYAAYQALQDVPEFAHFDVAQQALIKHALRDFTLSGVALEGEARTRYQTLQLELSQLTTKFEEHVLDATEAFSYTAQDVTELKGLPERIVKKGLTLGIDQPTYIAVMQYADNRTLREKFYRAYQTKASELSDEGRFDNTPLIEKILKARQEEAHLLGFQNYTDYSLVTKMAHDQTQIFDLLSKLITPAKQFANAEIAELKARAAQDDITELAAWDLAYYSEKLRQEKFNLDDEALRPYFPEPRVLAGLFEILNRLYGLTVREIPTQDVWDSQVKLFEIQDAHSTRGYLYTDLYARPGKRSGAWMDDYCDRFKTASSLQLPIAYLTCNFDLPVEGPALLRHDDVITLFHEFGHCLQHLLTQIDYPDVAGINGVPWDAVELPSQFFENWCWNEEALALISGHYQTQAPLPQDVLTQLLRAKNFQAGMQTLRQIEFAMFDLRIHSECSGESAADVFQILDEVRDAISVFKPPAFTRFPNSFTHIFAGGYAAGYYSYKWAEVLSADAFDRFLSEGIFNRKTGSEFLKTILESGGSREAMDLFVAFRGREPHVEALLKQEGLHA